jgi:hypothetical protein
MSYIRHCFLPQHDYIAPTTIAISSKTPQKELKRYQLTLPFSDDKECIAEMWPKLTQAVKMLYYTKHKMTVEAKPAITPDDKEIIDAFTTFSINSEIPESLDTLDSLQKDIDKAVEVIAPRKSNLIRAASQIAAFSQRIVDLETGSGETESAKRGLTLFKEIYEGFQLIVEADESISFYLDHKEFKHLKKSDPDWVKQELEDLYNAATSYHTLVKKEGENKFTRRIRKITTHFAQAVIAKHGPKTVSLNAPEENLWTDLLAKNQVPEDILAIYLEKQALHTLLFTPNPCDPFLDLILDQKAVHTPILSTYSTLQSNFTGASPTLALFRELFFLLTKARNENNVLIFAECAQKIEDLAKNMPQDHRHVELLKHARAELSEIRMMHTFPLYYITLDKIEVENVDRAEVHIRTKAFYKTVLQALWSCDASTQTKASKRVEALSKRALLDDNLTILYTHWQGTSKT